MIYALFGYLFLGSIYAATFNWEPHKHESFVIKVGVFTMFTLFWFPSLISALWEANQTLKARKLLLLHLTEVAKKQ